MYLSAKRVHSLVLYGEYMESMASHIGCSPNLIYYFATDPIMWLRMWTGPMLGCQFRLRGPGAAPMHATDVIMNGPHPTPLPFRFAMSVAGLASWVGGILGVNSPSW